jgi:hypothetical protein
LVDNIWARASAKGSRDEVARRLRSVRDRARPDTTRRAHCFDVEL